MGNNPTKNVIVKELIPNKINNQVEEKLVAYENTTARELFFLLRGVTINTHIDYKVSQI